MNVHLRMCTPVEVVNSLPALDLPPVPSPKLKAQRRPRAHKQGCPPEMRLPQPTTELTKDRLTYKVPPPADTPHWYALRCTYGRERMAYDYMVARGITAFHPTTGVIKLIDGRRKVVTQSLLPNIFFAYGTLNQLKTFVYDNVNLPFLRFYYRHRHVGHRIEKTPLVVPNTQMESLRIICSADAADTIVSMSEVSKFEKGQLVRVVDGVFKGVVGRVARWQGQQRVGVIVEDLVTVVTAYVPSGFLEKCDCNM